MHFIGRYHFHYVTRYCLKITIYQPPPIVNNPAVGYWIEEGWAKQSRSHFSKFVAQYVTVRLLISF